MCVQNSIRRQCIEIDIISVNHRKKVAVECLYLLVVIYYALYCAYSITH